MKRAGTKAWLAGIPWDLVVYQNAALCEAKGAHHGPASDGHSQAMAAWEAARGRRMPLFEVVELCRVCHKFAPFTNYNGNTFAAIARTLIGQLDVDPVQAAAARSLAGHIVAGVASKAEIGEFQRFCEQLG